jgi:MFS family permease
MPAQPEYIPMEDVAEPRKGSPISLFQMSLIIIFGIFATTLAQPIVLAGLPIRLFLKNELHADKTHVASFFFLSALAWYFKPLAGILTDAFPIFGTRRRHYLLISASIAAVIWIAIGFGPKTYNGLLIGCVVLSAFMVLASTVTGAFLVEAGQRLSATGRLTSVRQTVQNACQVLQGYLGGVLATFSRGGNFLVVAVVNAVIVGSVIPVAWLCLREPAVKRDLSVFKTAGQQLRTIVKSRALWVAIVFLGLFYFAPGFNTVLLYRQQDQLHFKETQIGLLGSMQGVTGILAAVLYGFLIRRFNIRNLILMGVVLNAIGTLMYLFYNGFTAATIIDSQNQFFFTLCEVSLMDLAARATPAGCEGLGYALILSIRNLAVQGSDLLGSYLSDHKHWSFSTLIFVNAGTTIFALVLVPLLPAAIMRSRDSALTKAA